MSNLIKVEVLMIDSELGEPEGLENTYTNTLNSYRCLRIAMQILAWGDLHPNKGTHGGKQGSDDGGIGV